MPNAMAVDNILLFNFISVSSPYYEFVSADRDTVSLVFSYICGGYLVIVYHKRDDTSSNFFALMLP